MESWPFQDPPNVAVITVRSIVNGQNPIAYVSHDAEDGGWQFHTSEAAPLKESEAKVVGLKTIVDLDPSVAELSDLPLGWHAWRSQKHAEWQRAKRQEA